MHSTKKLCTKISLCVLMFGVTATAQAAVADYSLMDSVYVGGGGGKSQDQQTDGPRKTSGKVFAGYEFNKTFSLETAYVDLGKHDIGGSDTVRERGPFIAALLHFAVNESFSPFVKGGVHRLEVTTHLSAADSQDKNTDPLWGAGFNYNMGKHMGLRFEWERFQIRNHDTDLVVANIVHYFR